MARRDTLAWHGGPPPPSGSEGLVTSVGINTGQAIEPDAPVVPRRRPTGPPAPTVLDGSVDGGLQVDVQRLGDADPPARPSGRIRLPRT